MRHGQLSDIHRKTLSQPAAKEGADAPAAHCPFGHYSSLFAAGAPASGGEPLPDRNAIARIADARSSGVDDPPSDEHGDIPAGYTYFGQLVVHDLTHSIAIAGRDGASAGLENLNTSSLDLDTIYGGGPVRCPHLYQPPYLGQPYGSDDDGQHLFYLGRTDGAALPENAHLAGGQPLDLPRIDTSSRGIAGTRPATSVTPLVHDDRNDDNLILSQLTAQLMRAHNNVAAYLHQNGDPTNGDAMLNKRQCFELARHFLLKAYRRVVLHDHLTLLLFPSVYKDMIAGRLDGQKRLPIEFVFGVARAGHAMVRAAYTVNQHIGLQVGGLGRLMAFSASSPGANLPVPADWVVDWSRFLAMEPGDAPQSARRISPFLAPTFVHGDLANRHTNLRGSLSFHDLWRCYEFNVPTGQDCARQLFGAGSSNVLSPAEMLPTPPFVDLHPADNLIAALQANADFLTRTPLSYYVVQEAAVLGGNGRFLGPLGSHILATSILHALKAGAETYTPPAGQRGLSFEEIVKPAGILTLPRLMTVAGMDDAELRQTIVDTLQ